MKKIILIIACVFFSNLSLLAQLVLQYNTIYTNSIVSLPLNGTVNVNVDWGDGSSEKVTTKGAKTHEYPIGKYTVTVTGTLTHFGDSTALNNFLTGVLSWDNVGITSLRYAFSNAFTLTTVPESLPTGVTDLSWMFSNAQIFNQPIGNWNTGNVTDMNHMFYEAFKFNQPIGSWNTMNVKDMNYMFMDAYVFNQPIGNWNTANVTNMKWMFYGSSFNQPIGNWNTANVTDMSVMFSSNLFNQPIGNWNTKNVTDMNFMFSLNSAFNQPIGSWNTMNVTDMSFMFQVASAFNQPIGSWNTGKVKNMGNMFSQATSFNQPIGAWNTENVTNMSGMLEIALSFNQPLGNWNTVNVTDMSYMFASCTAFNQPIGTWNITNVTNMEGMFNRAGLCTVNYDNLLNGWAAQVVKSPMSFDGGNSKYSSASAAAWTTLGNERWYLKDGGMGINNSACPVTGVEDLLLNKALLGWEMYPNPSSGLVIISSNEAIGTIHIYNTVGASVYQASTNAFQQNVDFSSQEKGIYVVKVGDKIAKLVKE